jgi:hypothetical protein
MAVNNDPNYPTNIISPDLHRIDREWCIGDSLIAINNNTVKLDNRVIALEAKFPINTIDIANNAVTSEKIRPSAGRSVLGQSLSGLNNPGDIIANNNNDVLRRVNNTLGFGTIVGDSIDNGSIGPGKLSTGGPSWTTAGTVVATNGYISRAVGTEGGQVLLTNPDNVTDGLILDVEVTDRGRLYTNRNNSTLQIGQLGGTGGTIQFYTAVLERMRISNTGNVGIGTINPSAKLQVAGKIVASTASGATAAGLMLDAPYEQGSLATIGTEHSSGCITIGYGVSARPDSAEYFNNTINGPTFPRAAICTGGAAGIRFYIDPNIGPNIPVGQPISLNERLRITNSGLVGINTGPPSYMLHVNGSLASIGYTNLSDIREKENINYTTVPGLSTVLQLKPATFDYKGNNNLKNNFGFIAQDIQNILPNLITTGIDNENIDARLSLKENNLIAILVKAIQDLKVELDTVKQELQTLKK